MTVPRWLRTVLVVLGCHVGLFAGEPATAVATVTAGFVTGVTVTSGGSGYLTEPAVTLSGGGGSGATAKAVLAGDRVGLVIVLTAGGGYTASPVVTIEAPPKPLGVRLELVPKLTVEGPAGSLARIESAPSLAGPWDYWTNVTVEAAGTVLVDLRVGLATRFYRAVDGAPRVPAGFVWVPPGTFVMGSPVSEPDRYPDEGMHTVTLTQGFWMSDHETTQAEYQSVMAGNPSYFKGVDLPVEQVSWTEASAYCQKLTERERAAGRITAQHAYRLPTEAEWEYAARAGTTAALPGALEEIAWVDGNASGKTHPVGLKPANAWGLHDMIGNVWEWCQDWFGAYPLGAVTDPLGPASGTVRAIRGGGWLYAWGSCRLADRSWVAPADRGYNLGFRPVLAPVR